MSYADINKEVSGVRDKQYLDHSETHLRRRGQQTFSVRARRWRLVGHTVSVTVTQPCHCTKATINYLREWAQLCSRKTIYRNTGPCSPGLVDPDLEIAFFRRYWLVAFSSSQSGSCWIWGQLRQLCLWLWQCTLLVQFQSCRFGKRQLILSLVRYFFVCLLCPVVCCMDFASQDRPGMET